MTHYRSSDEPIQQAIRHLRCQVHSAGRAITVVANYHHTDPEIHVRYDNIGQHIVANLPAEFDGFKIVKLPRANFTHYES